MKPLDRLRWIFSTYVWAVIVIILIVAFNLFEPIAHSINEFFINLFQKYSPSPALIDARTEVIYSLSLFLLPGIYFRFFKLNRALDATLIMTSVCIAILFIALLAFNLFIPPLYPLLSIAAGIIVAMTMQLTFSSQEKEFLRRAFSQFVSTEVLRDLLRHPEKLALQGQECFITVLFLDIRGFTTYSEKHKAQLVVTRLNELLDIVTKIIFKHTGTVDKYIGDSVLAYWGAPNPDKKQSHHAISAALEIQQAIETSTEFTVGIGIHYGTAIVGNIGSSQRFDFTVIGDTVNTAARLQSATKELGHTILISETVLIKSKEENFSYDTQFLGTYKLRGRRQPIRVHALTDS